MVDRSSAARVGRNARAPSPSLRIHLLGPFECRRGDSLIPRSAWRTRQTLALLKFLLDERNRTVTTERLVDAVWPDTDLAAGRRSLQVSIHTLRHALEPDLTRASDSRYIRTEPGGYRFDATSCLIDVDEFLAASQVAMLGEARRNLQETIEACERAAALYRGDYLADDPYSEWAFSSRERLRSRYLDVLDLLSASLARAGRWDESINWIERALDHDPLRDDLYSRLMRCHLARGRRSHALAAFERARAVLQTELGIEPSREILELRREVLRGGLAAMVSEPTASRERRDLVDLHLPFVGRGDDLLRLGRALERARTLAGSLVAVSGPPGIGKTRLIDRCVEQFSFPQPGTAGPERRVIRINCHEAEQGIPFSPLTRLLAGWLERAPSAAERRRLAPHAPALARLAPQARLLAGEETVPGLEVEVSQLLEAMTQAVQVMLGSGPGLLVLDDAHWADGRTVLWLGYALQRFRPAILTVVAYRTSEELLPDLVRAISEARRSGRLTELPLSPLAAGDLDNLLSAGVRDASERALLGERLHRSTGGLPLYVVETLRDLMGTGRLFVDDQGWWQIAGADDEAAIDIASPGDVVRDIIRSRVARLDSSLLDSFIAMCVIGTECRASLISATTGATIEATLAALDGLLGRELIRISTDGRGYAVEHPVVRQVVIDDLSPGRRQEWHRRVAGALRGLATEYPTASAGQVLHHLLAGDAPLPDVIDAAQQAGEQAMQQSAFADAALFFDQARSLLSKLLPDPAARKELALVSERRADALAGAGQWDAALEAYEGLLAASASRIERARTMRKQANVLGDVRARFDRALELLDGAERELEDGDHPDTDLRAVEIERGRIDGARATAYFFQGEFALSAAYGESALAHYSGGDGVERDEIEQVLRIGTAEQRMGMLAEAERRYRMATARAAMLGDRVLEARCRDSLGGLLSLQGRLEDALGLHRQTAVTGEELGVPRLELSGLANTANLLGQLGELDAARATFERALERAEALDARYTVMHVLVGLGEVLSHSGDAQRARDCLSRGIELAEEIGSTQRRGHAYLHLAELALLDNDHEDARSWAERGIATGRAINDIHAEREGYPLLALALAGLGNALAAEDAARRGLDIATRGGFRISEGRNLLALCIARLAGSRKDPAEDSLVRAERIFRAAGARYDLARTLIARAAATTDHDERTSLAGEVREILAATGARSLGTFINEVEAAAG